MIWRRWKLLVVALALAGGLGYWAWQQYAAARRLAAWEEEQQQEDAVFAALERPITVPRQTLALAEFAALIHEGTGLAVSIDEDALPGLRPVEISVELPQVKLPAAALLKTGLGPLDLDYKLAGGQLVITTLDAAAAAPLRVVTYPLPQLDPGPSDAQAWADLLTKLVEPQEWDDVGGRGWCEPTPGALVVAHRPEVHLQLHTFFARAAQLRSPPRDRRPVPLWPPSLGTSDTEIFRRLARPARLESHERPLDQVLQLLAEEHGVPLLLPAKLLADSGLSRQTPITFRLAGVSLQALLHHLLAELDLTYVVQDGVIWITTTDNSYHRFESAAYPVHDLIRSADEQTLTDLVESIVDPQSWDTVGGPGGVWALGGWLIVHQSHRAHEQLAGLLDALRHELAEPAAQPRPVARSASEDKILAALEQKLAVDYREQTLTEVAADLTTRLQIPVRVRPLPTGTAAYLPVQAQFAAAPARVQLVRILEPLELTAVVDHECLLIVPTDDAVDFLATSVFDVRPLLDPDLGLFGGLLPGDEPLIELLISHVAPHSWDRVGGPGNIAAYRGLLAVRQSRATLDRLAGLLAELRKSVVEREQPGVRPAAVFAASERRIEAALEREIPWTFNGKSLAAACADVGQQIGIPCAVDSRRLSGDLGVDPAALIKGEYPTAPARVQLQRLCEELGVAFDVRDDALFVTTPDHLDGHLHLATRIYDVRSLVNPARGLYAAGLPEAWEPHGPRSPGEALAELISSHVRPTTWEDVGGVGCIDSLSGLLIVTQSWPVQAEVERLLNALRHGPAALSGAEQRIAAALELELPMAYREVLPADICRDLSQRLQVPVRANHRALLADLIGPEVRLSGEFPAAPAWIQLQRLCRQRQLVIAVRNETLLLTTPDDAEKHPTTQVYDVRALLGQPPGFLAAGYQPLGNSLGGQSLDGPPPGRPIGDALVDLVRTAVQTNSWANVGGAGDIRWAGPLLVVTQTDAAHREVAGLLAALQAHCLPPGPATANAVWTLPDPTSARVFERLSQPVRLDLRGVPLAAALQQLARDSGLSIEFDPHELTAEPPPITLAADLSVRDVLAHILPAEVQFTIDAGQLLIADAERCGQNLRTRLYRVDHLLAAGESLEALAARLRREVRPTVWDSAQGDATIDLVQSGWLVIAADTLTHLHLDDWLSKQRRQP